MGYILRPRHHKLHHGKLDGSEVEFMAVTVEEAMEGDEKCLQERCRDCLPYSDSTGFMIALSDRAMKRTYSITKHQRLRCGSVVRN